MEHSEFSLKSTFFALFLGLCIIGIVFFKYIFNDKTKIVFCDVGQGDGVYIRTADKIDIVIDAGQGKSILTCLGRYMPFYDHTIELAFLSHPQKDHYGGYLYILDRYHINDFILPPVANDTESFVALQQKLLQPRLNWGQQKSAIKYLYANERVFAKNTEIIFFWPEKRFVLDNTRLKNHQKRGEIIDFLESKVDLNDFSQIFLLTHKKTKILFTGDASPHILNIVSKRLSAQVDILKVPHHGSKNGLTFDFLQLADPTLSVISAGKNNAYGHPSKEVIGFFKALHKNYVRTDEKGDVVIEIDHRGWKMDDIQNKI